MSNEEILRQALSQLIDLPEHQEFYKQYSSKLKIQSGEDIQAFLSDFKFHLIEKGDWNNKLEVTLNIINAQSDKILEHKSLKPLSVINTSKRINDVWIESFKEDLSKCLTGDEFIEELIPKRYKTKKENIIIHGVDGQKLSQLFSVYSDFNHPFINFHVASILYNGKNYSQGLPILYEGVKSIISYPHHYWDNEYGIEGASWMIGDLIFLLGNRVQQPPEFEDKIIKLQKLLFLYMSRYIYMTNSNLKCIDFYANRARILRDNRQDFFGIFGIGINTDIQFMSDMYLAHETGLRHGLPMKTTPFDQFYWESMKMYKHGSHIPNGSGGYQEIEDETWMQLVRKGELRSEMLANQLFKEFENYDLNISNRDLNNLFNYISETKRDSDEAHSRYLNNNKL